MTGWYTSAGPQTINLRKSQTIKFRKYRVEASTGHIILYGDRYSNKDFKDINNWINESGIDVSFEPDGEYRLRTNDAQKAWFLLKWGNK